MEKIKTGLMNEKNTRLRGYLALLMGVLALSLSPILTKSGDAPTVVTSFYRMFITAVFWSVVIGFKCLRNPKTNPVRSAKPALGFLILPVIAGISSALDHGLWAIAMTKTSVSNTAVLNGLAPVWISLVALIFLREKFNGKFWIGLILAVIGMILMSGQGLGFFTQGMNQGDLIAVISSVFYGGYYLFTQLGREHFDTLFQIWVSILFCALGLFIICLLMGYSLTGYSPQAWRTFFLVAFLCQIGGYFFITYALGCLPASIVGPSNELHSVLSSVFAIPLLGEMLSLNQGFGCIAIVLGVFLINNGKAEITQ